MRRVAADVATGGAGGGLERTASVPRLPVGAAINALSAPNPSGTGGQTLTGLTFQRTPSTIGAQEVFSEIPVPPLTISSGDFLVGFSAPNPAGIYPMVVDTTSGSKARSYLSSNGATFLLADASNEKLWEVVVALSSELSATRSRLDALERILSAQGALPEGGVEAWEPATAASVERVHELQDYTQRVFGTLGRDSQRASQCTSVSHSFRSMPHRPRVAADLRGPARRPSADAQV